MEGIHFLVQARLGSTRLPRKVLMDLGRGRVLIDCVLDRIRASRSAEAERIVVLTTDSDSDLPLVGHLERQGVRVFRGSQEDVFGRFHSYLVSASEQPPWFLRVCADNPFIEPSFIDQMCDSIAAPRPQFDYVSYATRDGTPAIRTHIGVFAELVRTEAFLAAAAWTDGQAQREHVTPIFYQDKRLRASYLPMPPGLEHGGLRLTIDTMEDLLTAREVLARLPAPFDYRDILAVLERVPSLRERMRAAISTNRK